MRISACDGDQFASRTLDFNGEIETCCVNFSALMWAIGDAEETMLIREENYLLVKCGQKTSRVALVDVKDFPDEPDLKKFQLIGTNPADIAIGMRAVHGFEHKERDPLTSMCLRGSSKLIECLACDGMNNARWSAALISADFDALVPSTFCDALANALERKDAGLRLSNNQAMVNWGGGMYCCKLAEGQYPPSTVFEQAKPPLIGKLEIKPLLRELEACIALHGQSLAPVMSLQFLGGKLKTLFLGSNENVFEGEYPVSYQCNVNAKSMHRCLSALGESCELSGDDRLLKMRSGDLVIYSTLMR